MDRRSGVLCHVGVTAYVRESGCYSWTGKAEAAVRPLTKKRRLPSFGKQPFSHCLCL
ncbi:hypothetical protein [Bacillus sp. REN10]|uniref:hypothetical protein n=1 Tax=Bacillus sp. REN10 TaxID=2782541 RepID=UPI00193B6842|nr:hypothetical protein [Bacillus sp. REN10]